MYQIPRDILINRGLKSEVSHSAINLTGTSTREKNTKCRETDGLFTSRFVFIVINN